MTNAHDELGDVLGNLARRTMVGTHNFQNAHSDIEVVTINEAQSFAVASAKTAIQKVVGECIPEKREIVEHLYGNVQNISNVGFNEAITTISKALKKAGMLP